VFTGLLAIVVAALALAGWLALRIAFQETHDLFLLLEHLRGKVRTLMTDVASVKQLVSDINDETNAVAVKVDAQQAQIKALQDVIAGGGTVTAQDLQDIADGLTPISARLKAIAADPNQVIPPPVV
jgi:hypothetical protein